MARGTACLYRFRTYLKGTVHLWCSLFIKFTGQRCSLLIQFLSLPPWDCKPWCSQCLRFLQQKYTVSKPTSKGLSAAGIGCLFIRLRLYFQRTVRAECSLFIKFLNISPGNCLSGCRGLSTGSAAFFYLFRTYIQVTVRWGASCFYSFQTYLQGVVFAMSQSFFISF